MSLIKKTDRIFIAGHKGMAGSAITRSFKKKGYQNLLTVSRNELDLSSSTKVEEWFKKNKPDIVVLAAAKVGGILANNDYPTDFLLENLKIQNNVIENSWKNSVHRLLFLGSSCIFPKYASQPIKEEYLLQSPLEPTNQWYAIAKIAGLKLCEALRKQYDFDAISLMPTNLYGPGDNYNLETSHVIPALIRKFHNAKIKKEKQVFCWGSGSPKREFLHVDDLGEASVFVLEKWDPKSKNSPKTSNNEILNHLNVGQGIDCTIKYLAELIAENFEYNGQIIWDSSKPDGTPQKLLDIKNISNLGWSPKISLNEGIKMTIKSYLEEINAKNLRN